MECRF